MGVAPDIAELTARGAVLGQMVGYVMKPPESTLPGHLLDDQVYGILNNLARGSTPYEQFVPSSSSFGQSVGLIGVDAYHSEWALMGA